MSNGPNENPTAGSESIVFRFVAPPGVKRKKKIVLAQTDLLTATAQIVKKGGANNLHAHTGEDAFWFVLRGRARFHGKDDATLAELGVHEGIVIPRRFPYWFESIGDETLEILRAAAADPATVNERINYAPLPDHLKHVGGRRPTRDEPEPG